MQVKTLVVALAALTSGAAFSGTNGDAVLNLTGASAIRANVAQSIRSLCGDAGGTLTVYKEKTGGNAKLENHQAYVCSNPMVSGITTVYHTTSGGSLNSILGMSSNAALQQKAVNIGSGTCANIGAGAGPLAGMTVVQNCALSGVVESDGGFSDVEYGPAIDQVSFLTAGTDGLTLAQVDQGFTGVAQVFGIAVSKKLYEDLQVAQGLVAGGCAVGAYTPACQPSISRAAITSLINSNSFNAAKADPSDFLGVTAGQPVEYARRVSTSGTQTSAQVYFLGLGCLNGDNGGQFNIIPGGVYGNLTVSENSGTSDVTAKLNAAAAGYAFGVVSGENLPKAGTDTWKFVKVNGVSMTEGTSGALNKATAIAGDYDYFVESVVYKSAASGKTGTEEGAMLDAIAAKMATPVADGGPTTVGLFIIPENNGGYDNATYPAEVGKFQRGGSVPNSCQPVANPF